MPAGKDNGWMKRIDELFADALAINPTVKAERTRRVEADQLMFSWLNRLQQAAGWPFCERGKVVRFDPKARLLLIEVPTPESARKATELVLRWMVDTCNAASAGSDVSELLEETPRLVQMLTDASSGNLMSPFLATAVELGIPSLELAGQVYQFGYGSRGRLLDYTFTDQTPRIGALLARDKVQACRVLQQSGIPVPENRIVSHPDEAEKAACDLGFPVVVKPADLDGGMGVAAGLTTPDEVREAFFAVRKLSKRILVEKHVDGRDYRLTVFMGELIWAVERVPGGVTGDGLHSVRELVEKLNEGPLRGDTPQSLLKRIELDKEALSLLSREGMNESSIPGKGRFVRLRRAANVACGGMPVTVTGMVHTDNRSLAIRAASSLRLDIAGVDMLIPDISLSWKETGAAVCEVNAQPGVDLAEKKRSPLYGRILRSLVKGNGRIPVALILGAPSSWQIASEVSSRLAENGIVAGWNGKEGVFVGSVPVTAGFRKPYDAACTLVVDRSVDAVVLCINDAGVLQTGLPFERFDLLVLAGSDLVSSAGQSRDNRPVGMQPLLDALLPCCDGKVMVVAGSGAEVRMPPGSAAQLIRGGVPRSQAASVIAKAMISIDARHCKVLSVPD
jgi:cyanophycin synthetase